ncbi:hypothetical protein ACWDKQ_33325, partial [Saccharopolyspora sp. NPDC000995]
HSRRGYQVEDHGGEHRAVIVCHHVRTPKHRLLIPSERSMLNVGSCLLHDVFMTLVDCILHEYKYAT